MKDFRQHLILPSVTARQALRHLEEISGTKTLFITDSSGKLFGSLTDGDVRRGLLQGKYLDDEVTHFMNLDFVFLIDKQYTITDLDNCRGKKPDLLPLLNAAHKLIDIIDLKQQKSRLPVTALIMAGGLGERLAPLTDDTPKPMLKVGEKPILEYQIRHLVSYGIETVYLAVNYLKDQIISYFGDGSEFGINIRYIEETKPLGTIGACRNLPDEVDQDLLILNADILTTIDLEDFYRAFWARNAAMSVATVPYQVTVPYAVLDIQQEQVVSLTEKPTYTYQANAGIYLLKRELTNMIPAGQYFEATELIKLLTEHKKKVTAYMLLNYWLDIGTPSDFQKSSGSYTSFKTISMKLLITICARGGSKGIPGKNLKPVNGKPLLAYSIGAALRFQEKNKAVIALSTDSIEIQKTAALHGLKTNYTRPAELATDEAGKIEVIRDLLLYEELRQKSTFDFVLDLDVTSPLRTDQDLQQAFEMIQADKKCQTLFSVNPAHRNPYFNMVEVKPDGYVQVVKSSGKDFQTRQSAPAVYDMNASFYFYRRTFFDQNLFTPITDESLIYVMPHICFDLDEPIDFEFLDFLFSQHKLSFTI